MSEKLIETVRAYTVLYDLKNPRYKNNQIKANAWAEVAEELDMQDGRPKYMCAFSFSIVATKWSFSVQTVKKIWRQVVDRYVKEKKKLRNPWGTETEEVLMHHWPLFPVLHSFLACNAGIRRKRYGA